jgi:hypothetical protein
VIDEESLLNASDSPFKSILSKIYHQSLEQFGIAPSRSTGTRQSGILGWLDYLIKYFLPTAPIWSNLLLGIMDENRCLLRYAFALGDLKRYTDAVDRIEALPFDEQRTTANSERRMCILKRTQLGKCLRA